MGLLANWPLWKQLQTLPGINLGFTLAFAGMVIAATGAVLSLLAWPRLIKGVIVLLLLAAGALAYFIGAYGIVFDPTMVVNMIQTDVRETRDLLSWRLGVSLLLLGALPAWWLLRRPAAPAQSLPRRLGGNLVSFTLGIVAMVVLALSVFATLSSTMRNHKTIRYMVTPLNAVYSVSAVGVRSLSGPKGPPVVIGADAQLLPRAQGAKPPLLLLVVGETARSMNFSLNGYAPDQPGARQAAGHQPVQPAGRDLLRHRHRGFLALHVRASGPRGLRCRQAPGKPAGRAAARRPGRAVAGQPERLQGPVRPRTQQLHRQAA